MMSSDRARTIRDPVWGNIRLDPVAAAIVDTPEFQRLRRVKQLGFAHLVYPGAVHTRFLHALGVYQLTRRAIEAFEDCHALAGLAEADRAALPLISLAALLHDVGHYAFSHAMEELEPEAIPGHHEQVARRFLEAGPIQAVLSRVGPDSAARIGELIRGESAHPLQGLIAGSLDLDKIDYLRRDGFFCGVPYGAVDVDRLLDALTVARESPDAPPELAVAEKGLSALESVLFSKYQMYRNVYWHHAVRAATVAFRRLIEEALGSGLLEQEDLPGRTDEELMNLLDRRARERTAPAAPPAVCALLRSLIDRRLPKRALELFGDQLPAGTAPWVQTHPQLVCRLEDRLADEWGRGEGSVLLDYPSKPRMLELELLLVRRGGDVRRLTSAGQEGLIDLPRIGLSLHHSTRVFRVFVLETAEKPRGPGRTGYERPWDAGSDRPDAGPLLELLEAPASEVEARLDDSRPLYR